MTIYETIQKDKLVPGANRAILSLVMSEITVDGIAMNDNKSIVRLSQMKKTCEKNLSIYESHGNSRMIIEETEFLETIDTYLPTGATERDVEMAIIATGVKRNMKSMGRVMGELKKSFAVVDGNMVKDILIG